MVAKRILCPQRLRRVPRQFSWLDQRLVREGRIRGIDHHALALYLFLVTVSDADGLSYYSDASLGHYLGFDPLAAEQARAQLCAAGLIAYASPLYQVLSLESAGRREELATRDGCARSRGRGELAAVGEILRQAIGGGR